MKTFRFAFAFVALTAVSTDAFADPKTPVPCSTLPDIYDVATIRYVSPQAAGDFEVTLSFPSLKDALCRKHEDSRSHSFSFNFAEAAEKPRISVRDSQGRETQNRSFNSIRVVHYLKGELSLLKAFAGMSDLDILTYFPKERVVRENLERGGSEQPRPASVSAR